MTVGETHNFLSLTISVVSVKRLVSLPTCSVDR